MKGRIGRSGFGIGAALRGVLVFGFGQDIYDLELWPLSEDFASAGDEFARRPDSGISGANSGAPLRGSLPLNLGFITLDMTLERLLDPMELYVINGMDMPLFQYLFGRTREAMWNYKDKAGSRMVVNHSNRKPGLLMAKCLSTSALVGIWFIPPGETCCLLKFGLLSIVMKEG